MAQSLSVEPLIDGWQAARTPPQARRELADLDGLEWLDARVPGTAAGVLRDAGLWRPGEPHAFDEQDWWFRTRFALEALAADEEVSLRLQGLATLAEVYLDGQLVLESDSMFHAHELPIGEHIAAGGGEHELAICCRALAPALAQSPRPRARWRTQLVPERNLRFFRTMLLGRAPGFAPEPAAVGPWREVSIQRHRRVVVEGLTLRTRVEGEDGVLSVTARLRALGEPRMIQPATVELSGASTTHAAQLTPLDSGASPAPTSSEPHSFTVSQSHSPTVQDPRQLGGEGERTTYHGELRVPSVARWWPHTHGEPALYDVRILIDDGQEQSTLDAGRVGFRELRPGADSDHQLERDGLDLHVNGVRVFARGAVWTPIDIVGMAPREQQLRERLEQVRDAGMNMVRLPGTGAYECSVFHELCDELGILVWQDFMFANFDYPLAHEPFRASVIREAEEVLARVGPHPSLAVLCGNSEVEQQVGMLGLDPALGRGELFGELLPGLIEASGVEVPYFPSAPCGGELPFRPDRGIANYYGVGGYRRPIEDARRAEVRFASECLAFANVPSTEPSAPVPRDAGADWDFADVRDHYLRLLFALDPHELRACDPERYLEVSRMVSGEVMAEVFGEWRRAASPCGGGLVLWLGDLLAGSGWGLLDHRGAPKLAYHHLARALAPVAVWTIDEGLGGIVAHVANDRPEALRASLRVALYRQELRIEQESTPVRLAPHSQGEWNVESVIGRFVDASWAYRFGPPAQDAIVVSLEDDNGVISQAVRFPAGRPSERVSQEQLGLAVVHSSCATVNHSPLPVGTVQLELTCRQLAYGVRLSAPGFTPSDDGFFIEPGGSRSVILHSCGCTDETDAASESGTAGGIVTIGALNLDGQVELTL